MDKSDIDDIRSDSSEASLLRERVALKLKARRRQQQLSLRALAARVGFSASFLSQVELAQVSPSLGSLDRIAQALGMHLSDLLSEPATANGPVLHHRRQASLRSEWSHATIESPPSGGCAEQYRGRANKLRAWGAKRKMVVAFPRRERASLLRTQEGNGHDR